ncbi:MAG: raffinose/stachyose/melibiose transport system substrate-binding protein [Thermomicrobiales bacterium]|jgi:raffinose/stachyose/melibiose transport system substrate-binding protein|nr:raffinose/stachyose/melibiose transport system substrate-binding protein [Thermomicrobiales bacterium]
MHRSRPLFLPLAVVMLLLGLAIAPLSGVGRANAQDKVELRIWDQFTGHETEVVDEIYKAFTEQNPNITITLESVQTDQMRQTVNTALASGTGPDIIFYDAGPGYAGVLANAGLLAPLEEFATQYGWKDKIAGPSLEATSLNGQLYGLPLQVDLIGMYYNTQLLEQEGLQVPETVEQLKTFCTQAKEKGYTPMAFSDNPGWQAFHQFSMTSNAMIGPEAMRSLLTQNQGSWNTPEIVTAIKTFFVDLKEAGCYSEDANALTYDDANALFYSGQSLLNPTGSWLVGDLAENMPDAELGFVPFPQIDGAKGRYWVSGVGSAFYISAKSQHQAEAAQLLDYFFSDAVIKRWIEDAGFYVPVQVDTASLNVSPLYKSILDVLQTAVGGQTEFGYNVDVLAPPQFNDAMTNGFQAIISGDKTPEELAAELQAAWEAGMSAAPPGTPTT